MNAKYINNAVNNCKKKDNHYWMPILKRDYPDIHKFIVDKYKKFKAEYLYCECFYNGIPPTCPSCGKPVKYIDWETGYRMYCSKSCINYSDRNEKIKKYFNEHYGVDNVSQLEHIKKLKKETTLNHYGVDNPNKCPEIISKRQNTMIKKYGVSNPSHVKKFVEKRKKTIKEKFGENTYAQSLLKDKYPDFIKCDGKFMIMRCPHEECNKCTEKTYVTKAGIYYDRIRSQSEQCTKLLPLGGCIKIKGTTIELIVRNICDKHNIEHIDNSRKIIGPYELDLYLPKYNIGIECNGEKWHQDPTKELKKQKMCEAVGVKLLTFWGKEIINNPEKVESSILEEISCVKI